MTTPTAAARVARCLVGVMALIATLTPTLVHGQSDPSNFTTVIDLTPGFDPLTVGSDTQVNLTSPGSYGDIFAEAGATNIEVNAYQGTSGGNIDLGFNNMSVVNFYGDDRAGIDADVVNFFGGGAGDLGLGSSENLGGDLYSLNGGDIQIVYVSGPDSVANLTGTGASIVDLYPGPSPLPPGAAGPTLNMSGGAIYEGLMVRDNSTANVSGGSLSPIGGVRVDATGVLNLFVTELAIDGTPQSLPLGVTTPILTADTGPDRTTTPLSGVLADGSPFAFNAHYFGGASVITATLVPEPATLASLATIAGAVLLGRRRLSRDAA